MSTGRSVAIGPPGAQGPAGPAGPAGAVYEHSQPSAATTWTINHNLDRKVAVAVFTVGGVQMLAEVAHISNNQAQVYFDTAVSGYAFVN